VGADVQEAFERGEGIDAEDRPRRDGRTYLELARINAKQLDRAGVPWDHIDVAGICTICGDDYYSYRREGTVAGQFGLIAAMV